MSKDRILIVEDAPDISSLLKIYFTSHEYEVMTAQIGRAALEIVRKTPPNLALLDVNLPDMEGYDIGKAMRKSARTRHIPIFFITGRGEKQDRMKGLVEVGAEYYIVKPFDIEEVHMLVKDTLNRAHQKNLVHPVTNMPTAEMINDQYRQLISSSGWALAQAHINGFETFTQAYSAVVGEDVLRFTALMLNEVINDLGSPEDFIGQMVTGPDFVITSTPERMRVICERLVERFDAEIGLQYNYIDRRNGYITINDKQDNLRRVPLMSLSIGVLTGDEGPFYNIRELSETVKGLSDQADQKNMAYLAINLPTSELINDQYRQLIASASWALAQIHINEFETFTQAYGVLVSEYVLKFTARLLCKVIEDLGSSEDFIRQLVSGPDFVITSTSKHMRTICEKLTERFDAEIGLQYNYKDRRNGYIVVNDGQGKPKQVPLMSLSVGILTSDDVRQEAREYDYKNQPLQDWPWKRLHLAVSHPTTFTGPSDRPQRFSMSQSHIRYGHFFESISVGSTPVPIAIPAPIVRHILTIDQIRKLLQECVDQNDNDNSFLAVQIVATPEVARELYIQTAIKLPHAHQVIPLSDIGTLAILPSSMVEATLDTLFDHFETHPLALKHGAQLVYGCANGPFSSLDKLIVAVANDFIERFSPTDDNAIDNFLIFQLEPERRSLHQRLERARKLCDAYRKDLSAQRLGIDSQIQTEIDQLTAIVDHDLGSGLGSLKAAIDQAIDQTTLAVEKERDSFALIQRQVILCTLWKQSIAELGTGSVLHLRTINIKDWIQRNFSLLCQQLNPKISLHTTAISYDLQAEVDPISLLVACLHMLLATVNAGAHSLWIESTKEAQGFSLTFRDDGEAEQRHQALQTNLSLSKYEKLPWLYQNLLLTQRILEQQQISLSCRKSANVIQILWNFPEAPPDLSITILPLHELRVQVEQLDGEVKDLEANLHTVKKQSVKQPERMRQILMPFVHELLEALRTLSAHTDKLMQAYQHEDTTLWRIQMLSLYCYLLVRNLALTLEGEVLPIEEVNVNDQICQVIDLLNHKLTNVEIILNLLPGIPPVAIAAVEMKQVLMNLVKNAAEAIVDQGRLLIRTTKNDSNVTIRIIDTGSGIPLSSQDKIFQLNFSTKGKGANSGVGLYAVHSIVQRAGGRIKVTSANLDRLGLASTGTIFQIELPIAKEA